MDGEIWGSVSELWVGRGGELQDSTSCLTAYPRSPKAQTPCASRILCRQGQLPLPSTASLWVPQRHLGQRLGREGHGGSFTPPSGLPLRRGPPKPAAPPFLHPGVLLTEARVTLGLGFPYLVLAARSLFCFHLPVRIFRGPQKVKS